MSSFYLSDVFEDVSEEADNARRKFGEQLHLSDLEWQSILLEEVGEAAMLVTKGSVRPATDVIAAKRLREEIVQVAAVAMRWVRTLDSRPDPVPDEPPGVVTDRFDSRDASHVDGLSGRERAALGDEPPGVATWINGK